MGKVTKKTTAKKTTAKDVKPKPPITEKVIIDEIITLIMIGVGLFLGFSVYSGDMGIIGNVIGTFLKGIFGFGAYILPLSIISYCLWNLINYGKGISKLFRLVIDVVFFLLITSAFHIFFMVTTEGFDTVAKVYENMSYIYSKGSLTNGGVVGGFLGAWLYQFLGLYGSYLFILISFIICFVLSTGISVLRSLKKLFERIPVVFSDIKSKFSSKSEKPDEVQEIAKEPPKEITIVDMDTRLAKKEVEVFDFKKHMSEDTLNKSSDIDEGIVLSETPQKDGAEVVVMDNEPRININFSSDGLYEEKVETEDDIIIKDIPKPVLETEEIIRKNIVKHEVLDYEFPPFDLLSKPVISNNTESKKQMIDNAKKLEDTLKSFGVDAKVVQINKGPTVTRYELTPSQGVKVSKIVNLADDIALNLAAQGIRIEAPIPGKAAVGIEVPNKETTPVMFREVAETTEFLNYPSNIAFCLGKDIGGNPVIFDIAKMPHLLIAGATGAGKSVCINTLITSILYKANPNQVKLILIDPKVVELSIYNGIPHLLIPVVTDPKGAASALNWGVMEMLNRYKLFAERNVRDMKGYNESVREQLMEEGKSDMVEESLLPQIVIIIDELADLMMAAAKEVEDAICRLAQMARAAGLHLIIATQRPSVDVITGVIKANIPSRLAFAVSSGVDSRTVLDMVGAEKLLGKGDMLFSPVGLSKPIRIQGAFISDKEVEKIVDFVKKDAPVTYDEELIQEITTFTKLEDSDDSSDDMIMDAIGFVVNKEKASISMIQRQFKIGYNRAANIIDELEDRGIIGPATDGSKPRKVLMTRGEWEEYKIRRIGL